MTEKAFLLSSDVILQPQRLPREIAVSHEIGWLLVRGILWNGGSGARRSGGWPGAAWLTNAIPITLIVWIGKVALIASIGKKVYAAAWRGSSWPNQQDDAE